MPYAREVISKAKAARDEIVEIKKRKAMLKRGQREGAPSNGQMKINMD